MMASFRKELVAMGPMGLMRSALLAASQNGWLRENAPRLYFVRRTVERFMPGETLDDAVNAAKRQQALGIHTVFTHLGENVTSAEEARGVTAHYLEVLDRIRRDALPAEISVKPTHLGLDLSAELCFENVRQLIEQAGRSSPQNMVWLDMESSNYVDATLEIFRKARAAVSAGPNVGVCLQAYLFRTAKDLDDLLPRGGGIRLVKGAYNEPANVAYARKSDVDENYFALARRLLSEPARRAGVRAAIATHDRKLIARVAELAKAEGAPKDAVEFQMLYGIQREEQQRLAREGWPSTVLIAYGNFWYPWFMRRLAERPANVMFILKNLAG
jgi:proline dehydrogenase